MLTIKQIEAVYWISVLGSFEAAARKLHTSQAAISKRVQELESAFDTPVFDRSRRTARLTEKGEEMIAMGRQILDLGNRITECMNKDEVRIRRFHFGITELTALTWLPRFVQALRHVYPVLTLAPKVDSSVNLLKQLRDSSIDLIVTPDFSHDDAIIKVPLSYLRNCWMCKPDLLDTKKALSLAEIATYPLLMLDDLSFTSGMVARWFDAHNVDIGERLSSNSNVALSGLATAGLGLAYLPLEPFQGFVDNGQLAVVQSSPPPPRMRYVLAFRKDGPLRFHRSVAAIAKQSCDFSSRIATQ